MVSMLLTTTWVWQSNSPGRTALPARSTRSSPSSPTPTSTMRPSSTTTSATDGSAPVPSTTVPERTAFVSCGEASSRHGVASVAVSDQPPGFVSVDIEAVGPEPEPSFDPLHRRVSRRRSVARVLRGAAAVEPRGRPGRDARPRPLARRPRGTGRGARRRASAARGVARHGARRAGTGLRRPQRRLRLDVRGRCVPPLPRPQSVRPRAARHQVVLRRPDRRAVERNGPGSDRGAIRPVGNAAPPRARGRADPGAAVRGHAPASHEEAR